ncbi:MAG: hypothetical protein RL095_1239 [Verrucomicrobiota bacterium]
MSFFGKLIGWLFGKKTETAPPPPASTAPASQPQVSAPSPAEAGQQRRDERPRRDERAPRRDGERSERRDERAPRRDGERSERRDERGPRRDGERPRRDEMAPRSDRFAEEEERGPRPERREEMPRPKPVAPAKPEEGWIAPAELGEEVEGMTRFASLGIAPPVLHSVFDLGFEFCTEIQAQILPHSLAGMDVAGKAQTGSGKTAAFLISVFNHFIKNPLAEQMSGTPRCLILAPTRELAVQIAKDAANVGKYTDSKTVAVFGGMDFEKQLNELSGRVDILVATPGRLIDYIRRGAIDLRKVEFLIIDEADRMLDMGFIPDVRRIIAHIPETDKRSTQLFSATLDGEVLTLAQRWLKPDFIKIEIQPESVVSKDVQQTIYLTSAAEKLPVILWHLKNDSVERMIIFVNRKDESVRLANALHRHGIDLELLSGDVPQKKRMKTLELFRKGELKVIVATDVAGRGIHVDNVSHVVNYELPYEPDDYVHRVGRTGRAGNKGKALSFACENSAFEIPEIESYIGMSLTSQVPPEEMIQPHLQVTEEKKFTFSGDEPGARGRHGSSSSHHGSRPSGSRAHHGGRGGPRRR